MLRLIRQTSVFVMALAAYAGAAHAQQPKPDQLLQSMMKAERSVTYSATQTTTRAGLPTIVARVQKSGGKRRIAYSAPEIMRGDILLNDGTHVWRYHRAEKSVVRTKTAPRGGPRGFDRNRISASVQGRSTLNGRAAWVVVISTRKDKRTLRKLWVDGQTRIRLRSENYDSAGKRGETTQLSKLSFAAIPASTFTWKTPSGVKVTHAGTLFTRLPQARRAANWLRVPTKLPSGYAFESAVVNANEAWLRYSNGVRRFSIFQQRTNDKSNKPLKAAGGGWFWQKAGSRFVLAGLSQTEAKRVAASVK